jgi:hypothetical protein
MRQLVTGTQVPELNAAVTLTVKTKCPAKWRLIDLETGEAYAPYDTPGSLQWKKISTDYQTLLTTKDSNEKI